MELILKLLAVLLAASAMALPYAHALELPGKRRLGKERYFAVQAIYYPNAYHSFDSKASDRTLVVADGKSHRLAYDPAAAPDAEARTKVFFDKLLRP